MEYKKDGRWPANFLHDGSKEVKELFPDAKGGTWNRTQGARHFNNNGDPTNYETSKTDTSIGSAARFFYAAKASKKERGEINTHPTVKPLALVDYLVRLVSPPNAIVFDPFLGSGTTALAALKNGHRVIGVDLEKSYLKIAVARLKKEFPNLRFEKLT